MNCKELYEYQGNNYTLNRICEITHMHRDTIRRKLDHGMTIEEILEPTLAKSPVCFGSQDIGKHIPIVFKEELPVFESMQPILGKEYIATVCGQSASNTTASKIFFLIELSNGKKLITYPGEFELAKP